MHTDAIQIQLVRALYYEAGTEWNYSDNCYPYNTLYFVLGGDGEVETADGVTLLREGNAYLIPAGVNFSCRCHTCIRKVYADVHAELLPGYDLFCGAAGVAGAPGGKTVLERKWDLQEIGELRDACSAPSLSAGLLVRGIVTKAVARFSEQARPLLSRAALEFRPLLYEIEQDLSCRLRIGELAARLGEDPIALSRKFKKAFGCSLKQYMERMLLSRLKSALLLSDRSVRELAADFGFCDQYYLCSFFKKHESISPTRYRSENQRTLFLRESRVQSEEKSKEKSNGGE